MGKRVEFLTALKEELEKEEILFDDQIEIGSKHTDCPGDRAQQKIGSECLPCKCPFDTRKEFEKDGCFFNCSIFAGKEGKSKTYTREQMKGYANHVRKLIK